MGEYRTEAIDDAKEAAEHFLDEIVEEILEQNGPTKNVYITYYSDSYHHENHVDKSYRLKEAAELLDDLHEYEETDSGIWEGLAPREAIEAMAAYTYGNAVESMFKDIMDGVNDAITEAEGDTLFWSLEEWMKRPKGSGVLDWSPEVQDLEALSDEEREDLEEEFQKKIEATVKKIVKEAIERS